MPFSIAQNFTTQSSQDFDYSYFLTLASEPSFFLIPNLLGVVGSVSQFSICCPIMSISLTLNSITQRSYSFLDNYANEALRWTSFGYIGLANQNLPDQNPNVELNFLSNLENISANKIKFVDNFLVAPNFFIDDPVTNLFLYEKIDLNQLSQNSSFGAVNNFNKMFLEFVKKSFNFNQSENYEIRSALQKDLDSLLIEIKLNLFNSTFECADEDLKDKIKKNAKIFFDCCKDYGKKILNNSENDYKSFGELMIEKKSTNSHFNLIGKDILNLPSPIIMDSRNFRPIAVFSREVEISRN